MDNCNLTFIAPNIIKNICDLQCYYNVSKCYCECINKYFYSNNNNINNNTVNNDDDDNGFNNHIEINRFFAWLCICVILFSYCCLCLRCKPRQSIITLKPIYDDTNSVGNTMNTMNTINTNETINNENTINATLPQYNDIYSSCITYNTNQLLPNYNKIPATYNKNCYIPLD